MEKAVESDTIVAVMLERSPEMIAAILGILKAGSAYMPIDPDYPQERINYMLKDSNARLIIKKSEIRNPKSETNPNDPNSNDQNKKAGVTVLDFEHLNFEFVSNFEIHASNLSALNLAYVIYTSGSTGRPKGVMINHRAIVNYIWWAAGTYVKNEKMDFPLYTSISFDLTVTSIFTPLVTGNTIVVYRGEDKRLPLDRIIHEDRVGVVKLTPSHFRLIRHQPGNISTANIKRFVVGGEDLEKNLALDIYKKFNGTIEIYNEYGPTEAAVGCMIYRFDPHKDDRRSVPIGIPINNMQIYIVHSHFNLVPCGVPGELCIGGVGVARGYLNRPELTFEKFRRAVIGHSSLVIGGSSRLSPYPSHSPNSPYSPIYHTGDLGRWQPDGNIEFLGRIDHQVKIRGFRIELGEIENHLLAYDGIKETVAMAREDKSGDKYLCLYFVSEKELTVSELREYLSRQLPNHMIPTHFIHLEKIPLTLQSKVDWRALPLPDESRPQLKVTYVAPESDLEKILTQTWGEIIKRDKVGIYDNFFELGGTSLDIVRVNGKLQELLNIDIPVVTIFRYPTISDFAQYLVRVTTQNIDIDSISKTARNELLKRGEKKKISQSRARKSARKNYNIKK
jgi:amino acid adenylation domain-containing protein